MYAVIKTGGKQYRVAVGQTVKVESLPGEVDNTISFNEVLLVNNESGIKVGNPTLSGGEVQAKIVRHGRGPKIHIIKFRRRKHHMKRTGHRQNFTEVLITGIQA
jgi:large subunit ribosomal protein L21